MLKRGGSPVASDGQTVDWYGVNIDGETTTYTYDLVGNLDLVEHDWNRTVADYTYDALNRLTVETYDSHDNSLDYVDAFAFDLSSNRMKLVHAGTSGAGGPPIYSAPGGVTAASGECIGWVSSPSFGGRRG
jgi:YD repeat-containing protein